MKPRSSPLSLVTILMLSASFHARAQGIVYFAMVYIAAAENLVPYCESTVAGSGAAIRDALDKIKRGNDDYLAWMAKQREYRNATEAAKEMARDPAEYTRRHGPLFSCDSLAPTLSALSQPLASEVASDDFKSLRSLMLRPEYTLVPPKGTTDTPATAWACLAEADGARALGTGEKLMFEGRPTEGFVVQGQPNLRSNHLPFSGGGAKPDGSTALTDWYVFCLLKRGYTWSGDPPETSK